jgi:TRAP transporter 4TM/12TM fusion protein
MVHLAALKLDMKGLPADQLPSAVRLARQAFLFAPLVILIAALFIGYSVIRAGTLAIAAAAVVSWLTPHRMGPRRLFDALAISTAMALQIIAVCAAAGVIVGVIALTGVGARFSALLLGLAEANMLLALFFAMIISIILGMGMPTTAAYAVAASVVAPGLVQMGVEPLVAHFFVFYFAVVSAVTPPVALAAYAASAIAGTDAMRTSLESFRFALTAFIVPFMFFYDAALLGQGSALTIGWTLVTATTGVWALSHAVQGWLYGRLGILARLALVAAALFLISVGAMLDLAGFALFAAVIGWARWRHGRTAVAAA